MARKKKPKKKALAPLAYHGPKILILDIETTPLEVYSWGLGEQNIGLEQIIKDWSILSWSAKWHHEKDVMYMDTRYQKNIRDDKRIVKALRDLVDEADLIVAHNGKGFDMPKLNARCKHNKIKAPSDYRVIDTLRVVQRHFKFTSAKLAYLTSQFCSVFIKSSHNEFPGMSLWKACLAKNMRAFEVMEEYNRLDVLSLEELWVDLKNDGWDDGINYDVFNEEDTNDKCPSCGSYHIQKYGYRWTNNAKHQRFKCNKCGQCFRGKENLLSKEKRKSLKVK